MFSKGGEIGREAIGTGGGGQFVLNSDRRINAFFAHPSLLFVLHAATEKVVDLKLLLLLNKIPRAVMEDVLSRLFGFR